MDSNTIQIYSRLVFTSQDHTHTHTHKKPNCRYDSRPYCLTADYLVICKCIGVARLTFQGHATSSVTWHSITVDHLAFPIGGLLEPSLYV